MCGFTGYLVSSGAPRAAQGLIRKMSDAIVNRGPDSDGYWLDADAGIALGHRRLAVVDLSPAGAQPMHSSDGNQVIVFNGEIYNHLDLRTDLVSEGKAPAWRGHSDTETLLTCIEAWGMEATVKKCIGMFAFAVWDKQSQTLTLGRDRLGEKPLYYGWQGRGDDAVFLFGSELTALKAHPAFVADVDRGALSLFMRHGYIPAPYSIYQNVCKMLPGALLTVSLVERVPKLTKYWSGKSVVENGLAQPFDGTVVQAVDTLESLLKDAVRKQMMADVPLGAFLSGGIDSSTIVALMQAISQEQGGPSVRSFTIGFNEEGFNEAEHAKAVARHLGTDHTELYVSPQQALDVIPKLPTLYSEPFADSSQIPTFLVSQMARKYVTVSLSGDAGDELFGGYGRYAFTNKVWNKLDGVPSGLRKLAASALTTLSPTAWNRLLAPMQTLLPAKLVRSNLGDKLHKGAGVLCAKNAEDLYHLLVSSWDDPSTVVIRGREPLTALTDQTQQPLVDGLMHQMMASDMLSYLPDDILCKVDRAAMGVSLETRVPMLDHRVVEFAWSLPLDYKLRGGVGKWPLRELLYRYVPRDLIDRPKMGFGVPLHEWLRGPLRDWAEDLLDEDRLKNEGYFYSDPIRRKWAEHLSGQRNWAPQLWSVLMFQAWLAEQ